MRMTLTKLGEIAARVRLRREPARGERDREILGLAHDEAFIAHHVTIAPRRL